MELSKFRCCSQKREIHGEAKNIPVALMQLFRFASSIDIILMTISFMVCVMHGLCLPIILILFGNLTLSIVNNNNKDNSNNTQCHSSSLDQIAPFLT